MSPKENNDIGQPNNVLGASFMPVQTMMKRALISGIYEQNKELDTQL